MTEDEERALWEKLARIDRRIGVIGGAVLAAYTVCLAWIAYDTAKSTFGLSKEIASWIGLAAFLVGGCYVGRDFYK